MCELQLASSPKPKYNILLSPAPSSFLLPSPIHLLPSCRLPTLFRKSYLCILRNETAQPHSQFLHSVTDIYIPRIGLPSQIHECGHWEEERRQYYCFGNNEAAQFHFWEYINQNQTFILYSHRSFICRVHISSSFIILLNPFPPFMYTYFLHLPLLYFLPLQLPLFPSSLVSSIPLPDYSRNRKCGGSVNRKWSDRSPELTNQFVQIWSRRLWFIPDIWLNWFPPFIFSH